MSHFRWVGGWVSEYLTTHPPKRKSDETDWPPRQGRTRRLQLPSMVTVLNRGDSRSWLDLQRTADWVNDALGSDYAALGVTFGGMLHVDDVERLRLIQPAARPGTEERTSARLRRKAAMLHFSLFASRTPFSSMEELLARLLATCGRAEELVELDGVLPERIHLVARPLSAAGDRPLHVHARYGRDVALSAFRLEGLNRPCGSGVRWVSGDGADVFFVTLPKTAAYFSPTTMHADDAITPTLIGGSRRTRWPSDHSRGSATSTTGIGHVRASLVREFKTADGTLGTRPTFTPDRRPTSPTQASGQSASFGTLRTSYRRLYSTQPRSHDNLTK